MQDLEKGEETGGMGASAKSDNSLGRRPFFGVRFGAAFFFLMLLGWALVPLQAREHKIRKEDYGHGLSMEIPSQESDVLNAVDAVVNDGIIQGSKEYNKDQYISGATAAASSPFFLPYKGPGKVFYKVRAGALDPRNFYESNDVGTLAVQYVVESQGPGKTILKINAVFVEDFRRKVHASSGEVENAEYKDIQDHIDTLEHQRKQAAEGDKQRQEELAKQALQRKKEEEDEISGLATAQGSAQTLEEHVVELRRKAERVIKAPGTQLKSAPFQSATNLKSLDAGVEVVIVITTPYWYGVETEDGQHGWVNHRQLEPLP